MFSVTQEYALRAVTWLASQDAASPFGNAKIAEATAVPASYLSKILQRLTEAKILDSRRGVGGGFSLLHSPDSLTVYDVVHAVDPCKRIHECPLGLKTHKKELCPMHARLDEAFELVESSLKQTTIREVMSEPGRPLPMVETPTNRRK